MHFFNNCDPRRLFSCCPFTLFPNRNRADRAIEQSLELSAPPPRPTSALSAPPPGLNLSIPRLEAKQMQSQGEEDRWSLPITAKDMSKYESIDGDEVDLLAFHNLKARGSAIITHHYEGLNKSSDTFITLNRKGKDTKDNPGWKIHIDLINTEKNLSLAWNTVLPILFKYQINLFKMFDPNDGKIISLDKNERSMTLYVQREELNFDQWQRMLSEIHYALEDASVEAGTKCIPCQKLTSESGYFSYRHDQDESGTGYRSVEFVQSKYANQPKKMFNPGGHGDPFDSTMCILSRQNLNLRNVK